MTGVSLIIFGLSKFCGPKVYLGFEEVFGLIYMVVGGYTAIVAVPLHVLMAIGGFRMRSLHNLGGARTWAIVGIIGAVLTLLSPLSWAALIFAIWALAALSKPAVKEAIRSNLDGSRTDVRPRRLVPTSAVDAATLAAAHEAIRRPAKGLQWIGLVVAVLCGSTALGMLINGLYRIASPDGNIFIPMLIWAVIFACGCCYNATMAIACHRVQKLRGAAWGYTGAGLGIASLATFFSPTSWLAAAYGIWILRVLQRREVQEAILMNRNER